MNMFKKKAKPAPRGYSLFAPPKKPEPDLTVPKRLKIFFSCHWRGVVILVSPIILIFILMPFPPQTTQWVGYTLILMSVYWVSECLPLAVTAFLPVVTFPHGKVISPNECCLKYMNGTVLMFLCSLIISYAVEQSNLHKRLAYFAVKSIGYSHLRLLFAICTVTCFASMWITNTAATVMMVPINFALLKVFEDQGAISVFKTGPDGELTASGATSCYFCAVTFSATCGGIGTLVGTGTNLAFKGFLVETYPNAPEYLSFPIFSAFAVPYMILLEIFVYLYLAVVFFGFLSRYKNARRQNQLKEYGFSSTKPRSLAAKKAVMPPHVQKAAAAAIAADSKKKGSMSYWEVMVTILFSAAIVIFFTRSPVMFMGWGDAMKKSFIDRGRTDLSGIGDFVGATLIVFLMFVFPRDTKFFKNCSAKYVEDLPKGKSESILDWDILNSKCPYAFSFLLGGGFVLSYGSKTSGLNAILGIFMQDILTGLSVYLIILVIIIVVVFITNFASNVAVCTVFTPIAMQLAENMKINPLWFNITSGFAASYCFMMPVGTPGNLIVQSAAKVSTTKMIFCGAGPTLSTILITWVCMLFWAPVMWPDLKEFPAHFEQSKVKPS